MAKRPVFQADEFGVIKHEVEFKWYPGYAVSQKQKSIDSIHREFCRARNFPIEKILEISSKSKKELGIALSAFNLKTKTLKGEIEYSVESAYQSSKVFEDGGPYKDILKLDSRSAKKDPRVYKKTNIKYFEFFGDRFELEPKTAFYDWLYINILLKNPKLCDEIMKYRAFTDIEFNPKRQTSTQAFSIALFVSLKLANIDMKDFREPQVFLEKTKSFYIKDTLFWKKPQLNVEALIFVIIFILVEFI